MRIHQCGLRIADCGLRNLDRNQMDPNDKTAQLKSRTKQFALRIVRLYCALPKSTEAQVMGKQLLRSGTSVAANYREACRSRSPSEFVSKIGIVEQELDETHLWLELLCESEIIKEQQLGPLKNETEELIKIMVASSRSAKKSIRQPKK